MTQPADQLSEGVLVEAQIRARLFGAPILRLDADVVLTPARSDLTGPLLSDDPVDRRPLLLDAPARRSSAAVPATQRAPADLAATTSPGESRPREPIGSALAHAVSLLDESAAVLSRTGKTRGQR